MPEGNNFILDVIAAIQEKKSQIQLNKDIKQIQKQLNKLELKAEIAPKSITDIQKKLDSLKVKAELSPDVVQNLVKQLETISNKHNIKISNISVDTGQIEKAGQQIEKIQQQISVQSATSANTVVHNEEKKQQAYKQTADVQKQIAKDESLIKSGANVRTYENTNNAAREASQYFKELLKDEQALISVSEKFNKANELSSFAVNVKRASGEVETLRYALENIGSKGDPFYVFKNIGAELNNSQAIKQMQKMEKVIMDYQAKLNDFKTRYSKTDIDFSGFETVFNNFRNGIGTVNDLKLAFNQLENSAKMGVQSLKSQSASLDPIQQALNNMRDLPTMIRNLETNMAGLQNKAVMTGVSISDLSATYIKLKNEMDAAGGKIPLTDTWVKEYQKLMSSVVSATKQATSEQAKMGRQSTWYSVKKKYKLNVNFFHNILLSCN